MRQGSETLSGQTSAGPNDAEQIRSAVRSGAVDVHFQPIVDIHEGCVIAYEALARPGVDTGFVHAGQLFETAERCGMLWQLEETTRRLALERAVNLPEDTRLFINTTPLVFADERFAAAVRSEVESIPGLDPGRIVLEITELSQDDDLSKLLAQASMLRDSGFEVAVDDVGQGTSGLSRIMLLRPQWLKLDREFVSGIARDSLKQNLVRFFVHYAGLSGVNVIAEGIETAEELAMVMGLGARFGQGYFLGRPAPAEVALGESTLNDVKRQWSTVEVRLARDPGRTTLRRIMDPAVVVQASALVLDVAEELLREPDEPGVVVCDKRRVIGWCERETVLGVAQSSGASWRIGAIASVAICPLSPDATVRDGMELLCAREEADMGKPLIIAERGEVFGVVRVHELLRALLVESGSRCGSVSAVSGMPGRVQADQRIAEMIEQGASGVGAAVVDIRRLTDVNEVFGYQIGDALLRELGAVLLRSGNSGDPARFTAHLGDDRFLIIGSENRFTHYLQSIMDRFDSRAQAILARGGAAADGAGVVLRVLHVPDVMNRLTRPRDLYALEQQLRQKALGAEREGPPRRSILVSDTRCGEEATRLSA